MTSIEAFLFQIRYNHLLEKYIVQALKLRNDCLLVELYLICDIYLNNAILKINKFF